MPRAEPRSRRARPAPSGRFEIDRTWLLRAILVVLLVGFVAILAKVSLMAFEGTSRRLERHGIASPAPAPANADAGVRRP